MLFALSFTLFLMQIRGFQKFSLLDYPGKIAAIVFTPGCTFRCPFCYNQELVLNDPSLPVFRERDILDFLKKRRGRLEGLVITGGEPTLQGDLPDFIKKVRKLGYSIKLDTNGSNPEILRRLLSANLLDYVAMDIKTSWEKYQKLSPKVNLERIKESVDLLKKAGKENNLNYEFRTTVVPQLVNTAVIKKIGKVIRGAPKYALQQYLPAKTLDPKFSKKVYPENKLFLFKKIAEEYVKEVEMRGA